MPFFHYTSIKSVPVGTLASGTIHFDVSDVTALPAVPFVCEVAPALNGSGDLARFRQSIDLMVTAISGSTCTATVLSTTTVVVQAGWVLKLQNSFALGGGEDVLAFPDAVSLNIMLGTVAHPIDWLRPNVKITRNELITSSPNVVDPKYNAGLVVETLSQPGNIQQPTAIYATVWGYAAAGNYTVPIFGYARHTAGNDGGAEAGYFDAKSSVASATAGLFALGFSVDNATGINMTAAQLRGGGLDFFAGGLNVAGNLIQYRGNGAGIASIFYGTGAALVGIDTSAMTIAGYALKAYSAQNGQILAQGVGAVQGRINVSSGAAGQDSIVGFAENGTYKFSVGYFPGAALAGFFDIANSHFQMAVAAGTPGANATSMFLWEGVTPTQRQVLWKSGSTLGAGDKVLVLV